jgi:predicted HicB family RNase H-like nuclease
MTTSTTQTPKKASRGRPYSPAGRSLAILYARIAPEVYIAIQSRAAENSISVSQWVNEFFVQHLFPIEIEEDVKPTEGANID